MKLPYILTILAVFLAGCATNAATPAPPTQASAPGMGMGMGGGMMERHHATIPAEYAGKSSPSAPDQATLERGGQLYAANCASCHGDGGMGDGPAGAALDPAPSAVAHTSQMMGDDYLFWRISEGGASFNTAMPAWKDSLDEQARWDVLHYVRALGKGEVKPVHSSGGEAFDPQAELAQRRAILAKAVEQKVITQEEAAIFTTVHAAMDDYRQAHPEVLKVGSSATEREAAMLAELVKIGTITQAQADAFREIHDRLGAAGLMP